MPALAQQRAQPAAVRRPGPTTPSGSGAPPSVRMLWAALAPPPRRTSVPSYWRISTGRLAAHALDAAVEELVGHQVGQHQHAAAAEGATSSASRPPAGAGAWRFMPRAPRLRRRQDALHRLQQVLGHEVGLARPARARARRARPGRSRSSPGRRARPTLQASSRSPWRSPTTQERARSMPSSAAARCSRPGRGLRQSQSWRYGGSPTAGWCGQ